MNVAEMLVKILEDAGVRYILGIPGSALEVLNNALKDSRLEIIITCHEQGAAFIAGEIAREKGLTAVFCNSGPAIGNLLAGTEQLLKECLPVVMIGGYSPLAALGRQCVQESGAGPHAVDWVQAFKQATKDSQLLADVRGAEFLIKHSVTTALSGRPGPVFLACPVDVMKKRVSAPPTPVQLPSTANGFDPAGIEETAGYLHHKTPAMIWAGYDVRVSKAREKLIQLAETYQIPVATTPHSKGIFPEDHPLSLGVLGLAGPGAAKKYLFDGVKVLLTVGCRFGETSTYGWDTRIRAEERFIRVDAENAPLSLDYPGDIRVTGNLNLIMDRLIRLKPGGGGINDAANVVSAVKRDVESQLPPNGNELYHPGNLIRDIQNSLPRGVGVDYLTDIGAVMCWSIHYLEIGRDDTFTFSIDAGGMGYAVAGAIGTRIANPGRITIAFVGDGAFLMNGMEVLTAVKYDIPVIWVVLNNHGYGMIEQARHLYPEPIPEVMDTRKPAALNCAKIAEGLGAAAVRVEEAGMITPRFMAELLELNRPVVLEAVIPRETKAPGLEERIHMIMEAQKAN
jgi:acetolactate synthase-1/2/3 large subunit